MLALSPTAWLTAVGMLSGGACWVLALALFNTTVQLSTPRWVVGRALSLYQTAAFGGMALGSWMWGSVAETYGPSRALLAAAAAMLAAGAVGLRLPLPARAELDLDPLNLDRAHHRHRPQAAQRADLVRIDYLIDQADIPEFLDVMAERQRIRRRDGARHWTLMRDLENPMLWQESYQTATWLEYVRHNQRRPRRTPTSASASARCTGGRSCRRSSAASSGRPAGTPTSS